MIEKIYVFSNEEGLHARPATVLVNESIKYNCDIKMLKNDNKDKVYQPKTPVLDIIGAIGMDN